MLLAVFFSSFNTFAQIPQLFLKFAERQNKVQSGYVKLQFTYINDGDTAFLHTEEAFFISTPKDFKYLSYQQSDFRLSVFCKSAHIRVASTTWKISEFVKYDYDDKISDAKYDSFDSDFYYPLVCDLSYLLCEKCVYQRVSPKINKKNIRYKIMYPDDDCFSNRSSEWEFERNTYYLIQNEYFLTSFGADCIYGRIDILEQRLFEYIHPDILDTISFKFEDIKKGYDKQTAIEQSIRDSVYRVSKDNTKLVEDIHLSDKQDTLFFMPEWKFPLLSGDTIYSDSIKSQFLLVDMWYIACHPCMLAMRELASIDTLYDESLLKIVSINVYDKDTAKISKVVKNLNLQSDVALAYDNRYDIEMSKQMGNCYGYPQLYLIDMETRQVIWHACGYYKGFTKDIEEIIKEQKNEN